MKEIFKDLFIRYMVEESNDSCGTVTVEEINDSTEDEIKDLLLSRINEDDKKELLDFIQNDFIEESVWKDFWKSPKFRWFLVGFFTALSGPTISEALSYLKQSFVVHRELINGKLCKTDPVTGYKMRGMCQNELGIKPGDSEKVIAKKIATFLANERNKRS